MLHNIILSANMKFPLRIYLSTEGIQCMCYISLIIVFRIEDIIKDTIFLILFCRLLKKLVIIFFFYYFPERVESSDVLKLKFVLREAGVKDC